jgi:hypothetical protein
MFALSFPGFSLRLCVSALNISLSNTDVEEQEGEIDFRKGGR